jgi:3',5'-cyclic-AMP phosphodiesterase
MDAFMKTFLTGMALCALISSCEKFVYHPNEVRPDFKQLNARNIEKLQSRPFKNSLRFILVGDTQRFYEELDDFVNHVNSQNDISFVLLSGDLVDFGLNREYNWIAARLDRLNIPYIACIGNHDMLANGTLIFREMFGPENFSFEFSGNKFICINTNSRESGMDGSVPNISWLEAELLDTISQNIFILSHVPPFSADFDKNLESAFTSLLSSNPKTRLSMHGHEHRYFLSKPYEDGLEYLVVASADERNYALITVNGHNYHIEQKFY